MQHHWGKRAFGRQVRREWGGGGRSREGRVRLYVALWRTQLVVLIALVPASSLGYGPSVLYHSQSRKCSADGSADTVGGGAVAGRKAVDFENLAFAQGNHLMTNKKCDLPQKSYRAAHKASNSTIPTCMQCYCQLPASRSCCIHEASCAMSLRPCSNVRWVQRYPSLA